MTADPADCAFCVAPTSRRLPNGADAGCPLHGTPVTVPRRLRTQAERDTDGTTWHPGGDVKGNPVHVELHPDECVLVVREGVGVMCVRDHQQHDATPAAKALRMFDPQTMSGTRTGKPVLLPDGSASVSYQPPRRRWWHRYTRRNP